jgi:hypothetical protein
MPKGLALLGYEDIQMLNLFKLCKDDFDIE